MKYFCCVAIFISISNHKTLFDLRMLIDDFDYLITILKLINNAKKTLLNYINIYKYVPFSCFDYCCCIVCDEDYSKEQALVITKKYGLKLKYLKHALDLEKKGY